MTRLASLLGVVLCALPACPSRSAPLVPQPSARPERFVLTGRIIAQMTADSVGERNPRTVLLGADGHPTRLMVRGWSEPGVNFGQGDRIAAWCYREGADTVSDSIVVLKEVP